MIAPGEIVEMFDGLRSFVGKDWVAGARYLRANGVDLQATIEPDPVISARVAVMGRHFEVVTPDEDGRQAILILARDAWNPVDVVAWFPRSGRMLTWLGSTGLLGEAELYAPRLDGGLRVFRSPLSWFQANRCGVVIVDERKAAGALQGAGTLVAEDPAHSRELARLLTIQPPPIVVERERIAA